MPPRGILPGTTMFYISPQRWAEMAFLRAKERAADSERACVRSWQRIADSQKLLRQGISGGSARDPLIEEIRAALLDGALPRINHQAWARRAYGDHDCVCCGTRIRAGDAEYEPQVALGRYAHIVCFMVWRAESARLEQADGAAPGAMAAGA